MPDATAPEKARNGCRTTPETCENAPSGCRNDSRRCRYVCTPCCRTCRNCTQNCTRGGRNGHNGARNCTQTTPNDNQKERKESMKQVRMKHACLTKMSACDENLRGWLAFFSTVAAGTLASFMAGRKTRLTQKPQASVNELLAVNVNVNFGGGLVGIKRGRNIAVRRGTGWGRFRFLLLPFSACKCGARLVFVYIGVFRHRKICGACWAVFGY